MTRNPFRSLLAALVLLFAFAAVAQAAPGPGQQRLDRFFSGLKSMRAQFVQTVLDSKGGVLQQSDGEMWLERPGRFRLEYKKPYAQLYVADGKQLWSYDKDLQQVTVRPESGALGSTPAMVLSGSAPLDKDFNIKELGRHSGFLWLALTPKDKGAGFSEIRLALEGNVVRAMEMHDSLGQTTRIYFNSIKRNPKIDPAKFRFTPPKGVDVIRDGQ